MKEYLIRFANLLSGTFLFSVGVVITLCANVGYAAWDVFHAGLAQTTGMSFGVASIVAGGVVFIIVTACGEKVGFGTIVNMTMTGVFTDLILMLDIIPTATNFFVGLLMLILGLYLLAFSTYFYMKSAFGAGARDNLMVVMTRKTKLPVGVCRIIVEIIVTVVGWFLGGMVGVGTVISAFAIGFFIQVTFAMFKFNPTAVKHETLIQTFKAVKNFMT